MNPGLPMQYAVPIWSVNESQRLRVSRDLFPAIRQKMIDWYSMEILVLCLIPFPEKAHPVKRGPVFQEPSITEKKGRERLLEVSRRTRRMRLRLSGL